MKSPNAAPAPATGFKKLAEVEAQLEAERPAKEALAARLVSPEMRQLNDTAQISIYGTGGKTEGFVDASGNKLTEPIKGRLEEIRENPRYGTKQADREAAADKYAQEVQSLVDSGFELCQAKLIMDKREVIDKGLEKQDALLHKLTAQNLKTGKDHNGNGITAKEAEYRAIDRVADRWVYKEDAYKDLEDFVRSNNIFTKNDFDKATGKHQVADAVTEKLGPFELPKDKELARLNNLVDLARRRYAVVKVGRSQHRHIFGPNHKNYNRYELRAAERALNQHTAELVAREKQVALAAGVSQEDLDDYAGIFALGDQERLAEVMQTQRLRASGKWRLSGEDLEKVPTHDTYLSRVVQGTHSYQWLQDKLQAGEEADEGQVFRIPRGNTLIKGNIDRYTKKYDDYGGMDESKIKKSSDKAMRRRKVKLESYDGETEDFKFGRFKMPRPSVIRNLKPGSAQPEVEAPRQITFSEQDERLIKEFELGDLPPEQQEVGLMMFYNSVSVHANLVTDDTINRLGKREEFDDVLSMHDPKLERQWLERNINNYDRLIASVAEQIGDSVKRDIRSFHQTIAERTIVS